MTPLLLKLGFFAAALGVSALTSLVETSFLSLSRLQYLEVSRDSA